MARRSLLPLLALLLLALCSCDSYRAQKAVALADSIAEAHPDSAYNLLMQVNESDLDDAGRAVYALTFNQAKYKMFRPASEKELTEAIDYFREHEDAPHLQRAYYYRAAVREERNTSKKTSLHDLLTAEKLIKETTDPTLAFLIYNSLCNLYYEDKEESKALLFARKSLATAQKINDTEKLANAYSNMVSLMHEMQEDDSVDFYLDKHRQLLDKSTGKEKATLYRNLAGYYFEHLEDAGKAETYYKESLRISNDESTALALAFLYASIQNYAKAETFAEELTLSEDPEIVMCAYDLQSQMYMNRGDYRKAYEKRLLADSILTINAYYSKETQINEIQNRYDRNIEESTIDRKSGHIVISLLSIFVLVLLLVMMFSIRLRKKERHINSLTLQLAVLNEQITMLHNNNAKNIHEKLTEFEQILHNKQEIIENLRKDLLQIRREKNKEKEDFMHLAATIEIFFYVLQNEENILQDSQNRKDFVECYKTIDGDFFSKIDELSSPALSAQEKIFTILLRIEKTPYEIKTVLGLSADAYRQLKSRTFKKLRTSKYFDAFCDNIG